MEMTYFVAKRHKIAKRINSFLAQTKISRASTVSLIDLIDTQLLNFGWNKQKHETQKGCDH